MLLLVGAILLLTIIGYLWTGKSSYFFVGLLTLFLLVLENKYHLLTNFLGKSKNKTEGMKTKSDDDDDKNDKDEDQNQNQSSKKKKKNSNSNKTNEDDDQPSQKEKKKKTDADTPQPQEQETQAAPPLSEGFTNHNQLTYASIESSMEPLVTKNSSSSLSSASLMSPVGQTLKSKEELQSFLDANYVKTTSRNPFGNVLLPEIQDNPQRKSAAPSFNPMVNKNITESIKEMVQQLNPGIENSSKQLFGDLYNNFELDQSNRQFFSTANTRVPNDQGAFANYLYGNMPSGKLDPEAMVQDNLRYILY